MTSFTENSSVEDLGVAWSMLPAEPWENTCSGKVGWVADVGVAATIAAEVSRRRLVLNLLFGRRQENDPALEIYPSSMRVVLGL